MSETSNDTVALVVGGEARKPPGSDLASMIAESRHWAQMAARLNGFMLDDVSRELLNAVDYLDAARKRLRERSGK
jgi:hypothetical protein